MWKTIIFSLSFSINTLASVSHLHLQELKQLYPYALLTDDFGILNNEDLKINQCIAEPSLFSEKNLTAYPYWQCFEIKDVRVFCKGKKYSAEDKSRMTMLIIKSNGNDEINEYISRRPIALRLCHDYLSTWSKFKKNEQHVCVSGEFIESELNNNQKVKSWIFDRYKTKNGCDAYFRGSCSLNSIMRQNCVVD